ncbi:MAG TPA: SDR family oxidoreductase [Novosphingobium sp.]|nr:SDR family oxidoreductase [Novosphingobium sp.]HZV08863.1 SDR family oxidoreductase [Novosphingobium sp.]
MGGRLQGQGAVVTGAGRGIGQAIVRRLAAEGAQVAALDLQPGAAADSGAALALACDVTSSASVAAALAEARTAFGRIDIAVHNAGIGRAAQDGSDAFYAAMARRHAEIAEHGRSDTIVDQLIHMEDEGWAAVMAVNLDGAFRLARAFTRLLAQDGHGGSFIALSSTSAQSGEGSAHYCASKAGIIGLVRQLARELAPRGIRVNAVAPGPTDTPVMQGIPAEWITAMQQAIPLGRMADPAEIAAAVAFLASADASFVTGSVLAANGGSYFL